MILGLLYTYLLTMCACIIFFGTVYYRNRGCNYVIKRIDFPVGLTAAEKKKYLENYIRVHQIGEVKNIIFDLSNPEKEGNLKACNYIYLDYVV